MGSVTGVMLGIVAIGGVLALARAAERRAAALREAVEAARRRAGAGSNGADFDGAVLDYRRDPADGVYRAKP